MDTHPIESLMKTVMASLKEMIDVNTIVGDPVESMDGNVIIPVSKVTFGFAAGGSEFSSQKNVQDKEKKEEKALPFGGGTGAGISLQPIAFLIVGGGQVKLLPVYQNAMWERILDVSPQILEQIKTIFKKSEEKSVQPL
ncbi:GerW family sporulation protein [Thermovenabulum gondwanense]|uniref:Putative spore protein YtfJ n=1 Tax=Thermovenabulum gondwanense TaxID=520767 RepID=A0A161Q9U7_9FIRM|nr:GerW family sporulation protein [Thermovenabulum gondwanense]KYO64548.1 putative spore protein YtfJ [Thermovenabulum gondwanense]